MRRRVWCETLPFDDVIGCAGVLAARGVELLLAVRPWQVAEARDAVAELRAGGVYVALWPMVADGDGRWASVASCESFVRFADSLVETVPCDEVAIDLEPPKAQLERILAGKLTWTARRGFGDARDQLAAAIARWRARGVARVTTAVMPMLAVELAGDWMQRLLGTPTQLPVDRHSVMAYTSLYEGWSRGMVNRRRAELLLAATARLARARFGDRAALSLGCVGAGAFGDEPSYRDPGELARDVAIAKRAGIAELSLFDLGGAVRRPPLDAWLDAFDGFS